MGERTRLRIGTNEGVKTVRVYSANPKTADGVYLVMGEVGIRANKRPYYDQRVVAKFKVDPEVTSLHGQSRIGESTFEQVYDNRFRLILQGVEESSLRSCDLQPQMLYCNVRCTDASSDVAN